MISLKINQKVHKVDVEPDTPLLWVIRDTLGMTGTKFGCGAGLCGACTVHLNGNPVRSCSFPVSAAEGADITTVEGLSKNADHPVQIAWKEESVPQCGYCQSGQIMAAAALLKKNPNPTEEDINASMTNICRCGTYPRIRKGIELAVQLQKQGGTQA